MKFWHVVAGVLCAGTADLATSLYGLTLPNVIEGNTYFIPFMAPIATITIAGSTWKIFNQKQKAALFTIVTLLNFLPAIWNVYNITKALAFGLQAA